MARRHREKPYKRVVSGKVRWLARASDPSGKRVHLGTFKLKGPCGAGRSDCCAQDCIDAAYDAWETPGAPDMLGAYAAIWTATHPRSARTNATNDHRLSRVLDVEVEGVPLRDWPLAQLKRRHATALIDHMLREQGRSVTGAIAILRVLSAMAEDAINDEIIGANPFKGLRVSESDPRARKQPRAPRVWTFEELHGLAAAAGRYEPMIRLLVDCGLRIGELFALTREGLDLASGELQVTGTAWKGEVTRSTRTKNHDRRVPIPVGCVAILRAMPTRIDSPWLFPTPGGRRVASAGRSRPGGLIWRYDNWRRDVWEPTLERASIRPAPHELRHSWITNLRAAGVDPADLADMSGHSIETAMRYTHPLRQSFEKVREVIG